MKKPTNEAQEWLWRQMGITTAIINENKKILKLSNDKKTSEAISDSIDSLQYDHKMQKLIYSLLSN